MPFLICSGTLLFAYVAHLYDCRLRAFVPPALFRMPFEESV
jgi:hypothetical protein